MDWGLETSFRASFGEAWNDLLSFTMVQTMALKSDDIYVIQFSENSAARSGFGAF